MKIYRNTSIVILILLLFFSVIELILGILTLIWCIEIGVLLTLETLGSIFTFDWSKISPFLQSVPWYVYIFLIGAFPLLFLVEFEGSTFHPGLRTFERDKTEV